jgi:uncharacterized protein
VSAIIQELLAAVSIPQLVLVGVSAAAAGFTRGFVGFGGALITILVLSLILGPKAAVAIATLSGLPVMLQLLPSAVRFSERSFVLPFGIATFAAAPVGAWILVSVEPALMKMAIAAFVLLMVAMLHRGWGFPGGKGTVGAAIAGAASGLIQGSAGIGGPPAVAAALARPGPPERQRGNVLGSITALNLCALVPFYLHGLFTLQVLVMSAAIFPLYSGATWLGARYFSRGGQRHFRNAALVMLAFVGSVTLLVAARDYFVG